MTAGVTGVTGVSPKEQLLRFVRDGVGGAHHMGLVDPAAGEDSDDGGDEESAHNTSFTAQSVDSFGAGGSSMSFLSTGSGFAAYRETGEVHLSLRKLWGFTGPGFLMSVAYLDPGNLEADLQVGAKGRYELLWVLLLATAMGLTLQNLSAKLGVVTGRHLATHCRAFPRLIRYVLWAMTEAALVCADCQEVIGSALALRILSFHTIPVWVGCIITAADCLLFMMLDRRGMRHLEALFAVLIATMVATFGLQYFAALPTQLDVLEGVFIPRMTSKQNFHTSVGVIGAVIMPHNLFLHSALVLSRKIDRSNPDRERARYRVKEALLYNQIESTAALTLSFVVNLFVVCAFAHIKYTAADGSPVCKYDGIAVMQDDARCDALVASGAASDCTPIGLQTAGECLRANYHQNWWLYVWALGVFAAGQASTITGTYAGQFIMEGFLELKISPAARTLLSRCVSLVPALFVAVSTAGVPGGMDSLNAWLNVAQSIQLPFAMLPVLFFASSRTLCGEFATTGLVSRGVWAIAALVLATNAYALVLSAEQVPAEWLGFFSLLCGLYAVLCAYVVAVTSGLVSVELGVVRRRASGKIPVTETTPLLEAA